MWNWNTDKRAGKFAPGHSKKRVRPTVLNFHSDPVFWLGCRTRCRLGSICQQHGGPDFYFEAACITLPPLPMWA